MTSAHHTHWLPQSATLVRCSRWREITGVCEDPQGGNQCAQSCFTGGLPDAQSSPQVPARRCFPLHHHQHVSLCYVPQHSVIKLVSSAFDITNPARVGCLHDPAQVGCLHDPSPEIGRVPCDVRRLVTQRGSALLGAQNNGC